jgi:hypothetical protein
VNQAVTNTLTVVVLAFMGSRLVRGVHRSRTYEGSTVITQVVRGVRWRHIWPAPFVLAVVIGLASAVLLVPGLGWGWWTALGGNGNPIFGSSDSTAGTVWEWLIPLVFICLLVPALPLFAYAEEQLFRTGAEDWSPRRRAWKVLQFGMVHALIGIPVGVAFALSAGGAYFMACYLRSYRAHGDRREATLESTRAHTAYNAIIIGVVVAAVVAGAVS